MTCAFLSIFPSATILPRSAFESSLPTFRKVLMFSSTNINAQAFIDGRTALHFAIDPHVDHGCCDMTNMVRMLLGRGASVELREHRHGDTPLLHAVRTFGRHGPW